MIKKMKVFFEKFSSKLNNLQKLRTILHDYYYGIFNPVFVALVALIFYFGNFVMGGLVLLLIFYGLALIVFDDFLPFMPAILMVPFMFRDLSFFNNPPVLFWIIVGLAVALVIFHAIKYHPKKFSFGQLFIPLIGITVAFFCGGLLSSYLSYYTKGIFLSISIGPVVLLIYSFFKNYIKPPIGVDFKKFLCLTLFVAGMTTSIQLIYRYFNLAEFNNEAHIGWDNINTAAIITLFAYPACFYLLGNSKFITKYIICAIIMLFAIYASNSAGVLAVCLAVTPILVIVTYRNMLVEKRKLFECFCLVLAILVCLGIIYLLQTGKIAELTEKFREALNDDNGRSKLYNIAWELFKQNPIFGVSMGYNNAFGYDPVGGIIVVFNFHSTIFHILATTGIFGAIMYFFYFFVRYRILTDADSFFNVCTFFCFSCFELYALIDMGEFVIMPHLIFTTVLIVSVECINSRFKPILPCFNNPKNNLLYKKPNRVLSLDNTFN